MDFVGIIVALVVGLVVGGAGVFVLLRGRDGELRSAVAEGKAKLDEAQKELGTAREELASARASVSGLESRLEELKGEKESLDAEFTDLQREHSQLASMHQGLVSKTEEQEASFAKREADLKNYEDRVKETFEVLSNKALATSMEEFLKNSQQVLNRYKDAAEGDSEKKKAELEKLLGPVKETLTKLEAHNREIEKEREGAYRELHQQIEQLAGGTQRLIGALQGSASAGRFGEVVLQRVVELAGMTERVTYSTQETIQTEDGRQRPDMLVQLPGGRTIIVDAKAPVHEMDDADSRTVEERKTVAKAIAGKVLDYAKSLSRKDYVKMEEAPDFTVMFVASESAFRAACEGRPDLIESAMSFNVVIATPSTLLALLKAVNYGWKQEKLASEAREVQVQARKLYDGLAVMMRHYDTLGKRIQDVGKAYNSFGGSLDRTVMPAARKFEDAGIGEADALMTSGVVEFEPRALKAQDFESSKQIGSKDQLALSDESGN